MALLKFPFHIQKAIIETYRRLLTQKSMYQLQEALKSPGKPYETSLLGI